MIAIITGFLLGLGGSLHCIGMCGPIAIALPGPKLKTRWQKIASDKMAYQFGRVATYTMLGTIVGIGGCYIALAGYSKILSITSGLLMILALSAQLLWQRELISGRLVEKTIAPLKRALGILLKKHDTLTHFSIGLLNGLLPCGLVTAALIGSLGMGSIGSGAIFMFGFGLGTLPLMSMVALGGSQISCTLKRRLRFAAPAIGIAIAVLFLLRGMSVKTSYAKNSSSTASSIVDCCK